MDRQQKWQCWGSTIKSQSTQKNLLECVKHVLSLSKVDYWLYIQNDLLLGFKGSQIKHWWCHWSLKGRSGGYWSKKSQPIGRPWSRVSTSFFFLPFPFQSLELCYHLSLCVALTAVTLVTVDNRVNDNKDWGLDDFLNDYNWKKN